jgi:carbon-monoxide dehydrogenase small subunit
MYPAQRAEGKSIVTIEGLGRPGSHHILQEAFIARGGIQCGYCTPGMILTSVAFLKEDSAITESLVREELSGNLCRCTGYTKIVESVLAASEEWMNE